MNYQPWIFGFMVVQFIANCVTGIYVWWTNKQKVNNARFEEHSQRLTKLEGSIQNMPVCANHQRMEETDRHVIERIEKVHGGIMKVEGRLEGIGTALDLIQEHLLRGGK